MKNLLKVGVKYFKLVGYMPLESNNSKTLSPYRIYFYLTAMIFITVFLSMWLEVPNAARSGLKKLVSSLSISAQFTNSGIKLLCLSLPVMRSLFQKSIATEKSILEGNSVAVKAIYLKYVKLNNTLSLCLIVAVLVNASAFTLTPLIMKLSDVGNDELPSLPLPCYFPFDYRQNYQTAFALSVTGGLVFSVYIAASNQTYTSLMVFVISQLEILQHQIVEGIDTKRFTDKEIYQNLRQVVNDYRNVSKFVTDFNRVMKFLNWLYFLICIAHTSMVVFEVVTDKISLQLVKNIWYLVSCLFGELLIWYWFGNEIALKHSTILDTIWESDWYNCKIKNKKTILILMMQVRKPLRLSVGFSDYMSLETMTKILRISMSYTITLLRFYSMKEVNK